MRLKGIEVLRGYAMGKTQLGKIADNIEREVEEALEFERSENAKLRDELAKWERLTDGIDLPEYPVVQFAPKDLERENAKLRELVRDMWWQLLNAYDYKEVDDFADRMRELGVAE